MLRLLTIHEAVPGHYLQGVYANRSASLPRGDLLERPVPRGLGRLRDPGDDGCRATAPTTRRCCSPTGSSTCARHERDHRRPDPHRRHDRGGGRRPHGGRRVPGGGRGARQVSTARGCRRRSCRRTSPARWRCGTSSSRRAGAPRRPRAPTGVDPARRVAGRVRRYPGLPLPRPPRGGHPPRVAPDLAVAAGPVRLTLDSRRGRPVGRPRRVRVRGKVRRAPWPSAPGILPPRGRRRCVAPGASRSHRPARRPPPPSRLHLPA